MRAALLAIAGVIVCLVIFALIVDHAPRKPAGAFNWARFDPLTRTRLSLYDGYAMTGGRRTIEVTTFRISEARRSSGIVAEIVVDDILVSFDDARAGATLQVLSQLAERTQVVFFTHHQHLLELAPRHVDPGVLFTHAL